MLKRTARALRDTLQAIRTIPQHTKYFEEIRRDLDAIRTHTWHGKESAWFSAHDTTLLTAPRYADPKNLAPHHAQMFSQNGEDGIIAEIIRRVGRGGRTFVELGVGDGTQNNTRLLLETGWRGVWFEADTEALRIAKEKFAAEITEGRLTVVNAHVTRENVAELLREAGLPKRIDFLSVDLDMNTSHVWRAVLASGLKSRVTCVEYNAAVPPSVVWEVNYDPAAQWTDRTHRFGAGLKVLETLGREHDLALVGCEFLGVNAFFVEIAEAENRFLSPFTAERHYEPPRFSLLNHRGHLRHDR